MVKIFLHLCWNSVLIFGVQACCMNSTTAIEWDNEYKKYDLPYNGIVYVGICMNHNPDSLHPQYILYEYPEITKCYKQCGIDSLLKNYVHWYHSDIVDLNKKDSVFWTLPDTSATEVRWSVLVERYIIYLAIVNGYQAIQDCETGYLHFNK